MPVTREALEGSLRMARLRRLKWTLYILLLILVVGIALGVVATDPKTSLSPFFIPVDRFLAFVVLILLVLTVASFPFQLIEVRYAKSTSVKHLVIKRGIQRSLVFAIVAAIVAVLFLIPALRGGLTDAVTARSTTSYEVNLLVRDAQMFWAENPLGLTRVDQVQLEANGPAEVYFVPRSDYDRATAGTSVNWTDMNASKANRYNYLIVPPSVQSFGLPYRGHLEYAVVVRTANLSLEITYELDKALSPTVQETIPLLALAFVGANAIWIAFLVPLERRHREGSIYK